MWNHIKNNLKIYIVSIAIPIGIGLLSALLTKNNMMLYSDIVKPPLAPPALLFPIVWTVLYVLMGISCGIVYIHRDRNPEAARQGLSFYATSLVVNFAWSIIFFNIRAFFLAFIWLLLLLYLIIRTILSYLKVSTTSAYLQIPYAAWVTFAGYLNIAIWILNR